MPTHQVSITPEQDAFLKELLRTGEYEDTSDAIRDAIRALHEQRFENALALEALHKSLAEGVAALDRGDYTEIARDEIEDFVKGLSRTAER